MLRKIRIQNFKCLKDTNDIEIRPITFLVGPNSSGKSSVFQAILALKQTVESSDQRSALILQDYVDLGSYKDVFFRHDTEKDIKIEFEDLSSFKWSVTYGIQEDEKTPGKIFVKGLDFSAPEFHYGKVSKEGDASSSDIRLVKDQKISKYMIESGKKKIPDKAFDVKKFYIISPKEPIDISASKTGLATPISPEKLESVFVFPMIRRRTEKLFEHIYHIGPLRYEPERVYSASGAYPQSVGKYGQWTIDILQYDEEVGNTIKKWLKKFELSLDFSLEELKKGSKRYEIVLKDYFTNTRVNLADVGFGASQILPIIVQGFTSPPNATLLLEQPEIHLHPKAQCIMGDLLVDIAKTDNKRLIIETHSDLLIERVCKHILLRDETRISPEDIIIYYFEPSKEGTIVRPITVNENAQYENFPEGFFEERFEEALARAELME
jgi:predicted ATPase